MTSESSVTAAPAGRSVWWRDPFWRSIIYQAITFVCFTVLVWYMVDNTIANLERQGRNPGFDFLFETQGIPVSQSLIDYQRGTSTYLDLFLLGLLNTILVAIVGIFFATILGFVIGVARLSNNWLISTLATWYVEIFRNIPLLLQILFWYNAVLKQLPAPGEAFSLYDTFFLSNRALTVPDPAFNAAFWPVGIVLVTAIIATIMIRRWAKQRQEATGQRFPVLLTGVGLIIGAPIVTYLVVMLLVGDPISFGLPKMGRFNLDGGMEILPEFAALLLALSVYTAAFIAEAVRSGIQAVSHGQTEAAFALGLRPRITTKLIIIPQALRVIIPQLTNQYLNLTKNSSLGGAIGYSELVHVYMGTALTTSGHELEIVAMTMGTYLLLSLGTSAFMNWYNKRIALAER